MKKNEKKGTRTVFVEKTPAEVRKAIQGHRKKVDKLEATLNEIIVETGGEVPVSFMGLGALLKDAKKALERAEDGLDNTLRKVRRANDVG